MDGSVIVNELRYTGTAYSVPSIGVPYSTNGPYAGAGVPPYLSAGSPYVTVDAQYGQNNYVQVCYICFLSEKLLNVLGTYTRW